VVSIAGAAAVEAVEANIEAVGVVLSFLSVAKALQSYGTGLTIESKHCVQSSRYTDCVGPGGRSSIKRQYDGARCMRGTCQPH
jgi:hypothetical protein